MVFDFPTKYEDIGTIGDELWNDLMPRKQLSAEARGTKR